MLPYANGVVRELTHFSTAANSISDVNVTEAQVNFQPQSGDASEESAECRKKVSKAALV